MKSLTAFLQVLLHEMGEWCHTSTIRDSQTISERVEHEGVSFLTITLPSFGKDLEKGLDQGFVDRNLFQGFSWRAGLPAFLGGFLDLVFDRATGVLLDTPSVSAIRAIRQITLALGKVEIDCSAKRVDAALRGYLECEQGLRKSDLAFVGENRERFERISSMLFAPLFSDLDLAVYEGTIVPKHGPGATADKLRGNAKYNQREWTRRLEEYFPFGEFLFSSWRLAEPDAVRILEPRDERPVKVITVPKTLKTPRIIAEEPTCMQYVQQGLLEVIKEGFRSHDYARSFVCFDSQEPNRDLARRGSIHGDLATLDLSEASDRVSNQQVLALLRNHPHLSAGVQACRSRKADVLGKTVRLAKFASMGSALCFPFEALVFSTIVFIGIEQGLGRRLTHSDIKSLRGQVRVYGDDIIVPVHFVDHVVAALSLFGMKVNASKSFWTGKFRESCGGDFYDGHDVSVVRVRQVIASRRGSTEEIVSTVSLRNQLFERGCQKTVDWLDSKLDRVLPVFPVVEPGSPGLGRWSWSPPTAERFHPTLHTPLVKACVVVARLPRSYLDGPDALIKWFLKRGTLPFQDEDHLFRAGRPVSVDIKTRWIDPCERIEGDNQSPTGRLVSKAA